MPRALHHAHQMRQIGGAPGRPPAHRIHQMLQIGGAPGAPAGPSDTSNASNWAPPGAPRWSIRHTERIEYMQRALAAFHLSHWAPESPHTSLPLPGLTASACLMSRTAVWEGPTMAGEMQPACLATAAQCRAAVPTGFLEPRGAATPTAGGHGGTGDPSTGLWHTAWSI